MNCILIITLIVFLLSLLIALTSGLNIREATFMSIIATIVSMLLLIAFIMDQEIRDNKTNVERLK